MVLKDLLGTISPGAEKHIEGRLDADISLAGAGKTWEEIQKVLRGDGRMEVKDGVLKDVNIAEGVLSGVTGIPGLSDMISLRVREKYPELFGAEDTRFDKLSGTVVVAEGRAKTEDLTLSARDYTILGKGTFAFENYLDFIATFSASQQLTDDVVSDATAAKFVTNDQGRLAVPFRVAGALPDIRPKPDSEFIAKALRRGLVEGGLEKLFGSKKKSGDATEASEEEKLSPELDLIKKGLEGLFGR